MRSPGRYRLPLAGAIANVEPAGAVRGHIEILTKLRGSRAGSDLSYMPINRPPGTACENCAHLALKRVVTLIYISLFLYIRSSELNSRLFPYIFVRDIISYVYPTRPW